MKIMRSLLIIVLSSLPFFTTLSAHSPSSSIVAERGGERGGHDHSRGEGRSDFGGQHGNFNRSEGQGHRGEYNRSEGQGHQGEYNRSEGQGHQGEYNRSEGQGHQGEFNRYGGAAHLDEFNRYGGSNHWGENNVNIQGGGGYQGAPVITPGEQSNMLYYYDVQH